MRSQQSIQGVELLSGLCPSPLMSSLQGDQGAVVPEFEYKSITLIRMNFLYTQPIGALNPASFVANSTAWLNANAPAIFATMNYGDATLMYGSNDDVLSDVRTVGIFPPPWSDITDPAFTNPQPQQGLSVGSSWRQSFAASVMITKLRVNYPTVFILGGAYFSVADLGQNLTSITGPQVSIVQDNLNPLNLVQEFILPIPAYDPAWNLQPGYNGRHVYNNPSGLEVYFVPTVAQ